MKKRLAVTMLCVAMTLGMLAGCGGESQPSGGGTEASNGGGGGNSGGQVIW